MFVFGILIHVTFLFSIFDIYFKSPIVRNVDPYQPQHDQLADRLVLFVVDGLRAESFVNYSTMPYLRLVFFFLIFERIMKLFNNFYSMIYKMFPGL